MVDWKVGGKDIAPFPPINVWVASLPEILILWLHFLSTSASLHGSFRAGPISFEIPTTVACF